MYPQNPSQYYDPNKIESTIPIPVPPPQNHHHHHHHQNIGYNNNNNTVPPMYNQTPHHVPGKWSTGLCHCCDDPANCLVTAFCPCITFGQIADIADRGTCPCSASGAAYGLLCAFTGFPCLYSCFYRSKLRSQYDIEETYPDCLVHFCCEHCALCQEHRELKNRGFDMGIGWIANMERKSRGVMMQAPVMGAPVMGGMMR